MERLLPAVADEDKLEHSARADVEPQNEFVTSEDETDIEVRGFFQHMESKEFHSVPPSGAIRPVPIRPRSYKYTTSGEKSPRSHSLFQSTCQHIGQLAEDLSPVSSEIATLVNGLKTKDREVRFQRLQRLHALEREDALLAQIASYDHEDVEHTCSEHDMACTCIHNLQVENDILQNQVRQLTCKEQTAGGQVTRLLQVIDLVKGGLQTNGGDGMGDREDHLSTQQRRTDPAVTYSDVNQFNTDKSNRSTNINGPGISQSGYQIHRTLDSPFRFINCSYSNDSIRNAKNGIAQRLAYSNDSIRNSNGSEQRLICVPKLKSNESNDSTFLERLRFMFSRIRG